MLLKLTALGALGYVGYQYYQKNFKYEGRAAFARGQGEEGVIPDPRSGQSCACRLKPGQFDHQCRGAVGVFRRADGKAVQGHQVGVGAEGQAMALGHGDGQVEAGGG